MPLDRPTVAGSNGIDRVRPIPLVDSTMAVASGFGSMRAFSKPREARARGKRKRSHPDSIRFARATGFSNLRRGRLNLTLFVDRSARGSTGAAAVRSIWGLGWRCSDRRLGFPIHGMYLGASDAQGRLGRLRACLGVGKRQARKPTRDGISSLAYRHVPADWACRGRSANAHPRSLSTPDPPD